MPKHSKAKTAKDAQKRLKKLVKKKTQDSHNSATHLGMAWSESCHQERHHPDSVAVPPVWFCPQVSGLFLQGLLQIPVGFSQGVEAYEVVSDERL